MLTKASAGGRRIPLAAHLVLVLTLAVAAPAAASDAGPTSDEPTDNRSGYVECADGDELEVSSVASGGVIHRVDGEIVGSWFNYIYGVPRTASGPSYDGHWEVEAWSGWINSVDVQCHSTNDGDGDGDGGGGGGGGDRCHLESAHDAGTMYCPPEY